MINGLKYLSYKEGLKTRSVLTIISAYKELKGEHNENRSRLFLCCQVTWQKASGTKRNNTENKIWTAFFVVLFFAVKDDKYWNKSLRLVLESLCLDILKIQLSTVLNIWPWKWTTWSPMVSARLNTPWLCEKKLMEGIWKAHVNRSRHYTKFGLINFSLILKVMTQFLCVVIHASVCSSCKIRIFLDYHNS